MAAKPKKTVVNLQTLIDLTKTTQTLLQHYQTSLHPPKTSAQSNTSQPQQPSSSTSSTPPPNPIQTIRATTILLRSHTTTLSLLLLTPPLTPSALVTKIGDVSSSVMGSMVAATLYTPPAGEVDSVGTIMRTEMRSQVWRLLGTWGDIVGLVGKRAENARKEKGGKEAAMTEQERQTILGATGVVWDSCDALVKLCDDGAVALVVKKAEEWRAVLLDAVEELKEWGEDAVDDDEDEDDAEVDDEDEDDMFGTGNKLRKSDEQMKKLLDLSVKKLKMMGMLYQAVIKRRLRSYQATSSTTTSTTTTTSTEEDSNGANINGINPLPHPATTLDALLAILKSIPSTADDLASAFYDLDRESAQDELSECCEQAKRVVELVRKNWVGGEDEFTVWSEKWVGALDGAT